MRSVRVSYVNLCLSGAFVGSAMAVPFTSITGHDATRCNATRRDTPQDDPLKLAAMTTTGLEPETRSNAKYLL